MADIAMRLGADVLVVAGTMDEDLRAQGFVENPSTLNVTEDETVLELHRLYRLAGADCALTNTANATSARLQADGLVGATVEVSVAGVRLARQAEFPHVLGSITSCGIEVEPGSGSAVCPAAAPTESRSTVADAADWAPGFGAAVEQYAEQAAALASAGPDAIVALGFTSVDDALAALEASRRTLDAPVLVCMALDGESDVEGVTRRLAAAGASAVGCCGLPVEETLQIVARMRSACDLPLMALPDITGLSGARVSDDAVRLVAAGATLIGSTGGSRPSQTGAIYASVGGLELPARD